MITTSTPETKFIEKAETGKEEKVQLPEFDSPSEKTVNAILNFSRNLEVKESEMVKNIEFIKS